ncbi:hypothetical protein CGLAR1_12535 [Corynebacterium glutamicum]|nr:hypothetical protein CGLAR1_12535 [Corynebacterium glutamicum]AIK88813.1 hypothetical protein AR0_12670 [Corynebacterium glutamicum]
MAKIKKVQVTHPMEQPENYTAENLRELRDTSKMSRQTLIEKLRSLGIDMHANSLRRIEEGSQPMKIHEAVAFAQIFKIGLEQFITQPINSEAAKVREALAHLVSTRMRLETLLLHLMQIRDDYQQKIEAGEFMPPEQLKASARLASTISADEPVIADIERLSRHFGGQ